MNASDSPVIPDERAATLSLDEITARADPGATISPAALEVARTFASRAPHDPPVEAVELPRVSLSDAALVGAGTPDIVIVRELGQGGMGRVDLARQTVFDRTVAVKRVRPDRLCETAVRALLAEARLSSALDHPNIVPVHLLGRTETGEPVLVMKRVEGTAWLDLVRAAGPGGLRGEALARHLEILRQVCNAVEFAHRQGVIHRDIKLENVMVGELGEVYLLDWGVATRAGCPPTTELAGTPSYMAPEMLPGAGTVTARTDVYLLGATLFEMLAGHPLHQGETMWAVLGSAMRSEPAALDPSVPDELAALVRRATARDPGERFPSALAFGDAIAEFQRHRGSLDLSDEAARLLGALRDAFARVTAEPGGAARAHARRSSQECAFGFRQALRAWPDNPHARDGLRECLELTVAFELAERNVPNVEVLLAEHPSPPAGQVAALDRLKAELAEEALAPAKLASMVRDNDVFLDGSTGGRSPAVFCAVMAVVYVALSLRGVRLTGGLYVALCLALCALAGLTVYAERAAMMFNRASARRLLGTLVVLPFNLLVAVVGYVQGTPVVQAVQTAFLGQALMAVLVGVTVTRVLLVGAPIYLAGLAALIAWPQEGLLSLGVLAALQAVVNRLEARVVRAHAGAAAPERAAA